MAGHDDHSSPNQSRLRGRVLVRRRAVHSDSSSLPGDLCPGRRRRFLRGRARIWVPSGLGPAGAVEYGAAQVALAMTTPGDTPMTTLAEVEHVMRGGGARV